MGGGEEGGEGEGATEGKLAHVKLSDIVGI